MNSPLPSKERFPAQTVQQIADDYVEHYELEADEGTYHPNDTERMLIADAVNGLTGDEGFCDRVAEYVIDRQQRRAAAGDCLGCGAPNSTHWGICDGKPRVNLGAAHEPATHDPASINKLGGNNEPQPAASKEQRLEAIRKEYFCGNSAADEIERLQRQLPEGMGHCTIRFLQCEKGHGRLTADNWIDHGCQHCEVARLIEANQAWHRRVLLGAALEPPPEHQRDLRRYFNVLPCVVDGEPDACRIDFHVGVQTFMFGPEYCENRDQAEWFIGMGVKALQNVIAAFTPPPAVLHSLDCALSHYAATPPPICNCGADPTSGTDSRNETERGGPTGPCPGETTASLGEDSQRRASVQLSRIRETMECNDPIAARDIFGTPTIHGAQPSLTKVVK